MLYLIKSSQKVIRSKLTSLPSNILEHYKYDYNKRLESLSAYYIFNLWLQNNFKKYDYLEDIIFINNKPFFKTHSYIKFSISHSHGHIAILISKSQSINNLGIDIEIFNKKSDRIIQKYGSSSEIKWYFKKNNLSQRKKFYISWCSKEAFLKAYGIGVSHLLEISFIPNKKIFSSSIGKGKIKSFEYKNIFISIFINSSIKDEINNITSYNFQSDKFRKIKESKFQLNYKVNSIKIL